LAENPGNGGIPAKLNIEKTKIQLNQGFELYNDTKSTIFRIFEEFRIKRTDINTLKSCINDNK